MGWVSAEAVLAVVRPALVTLEERTAEEEVLEEELLLTALPLVLELDLVALEELLLEREVELLPDERELLLCWVELPPLERRVWAHISGAVSMAKASMVEAAIVINLLIALKFLS